MHRGQHSQSGWSGFGQISFFDRKSIIHTVCTSMRGMALSFMVLAHAQDVIKTHACNLVIVISTPPDITKSPHQPWGATFPFRQNKIVAWSFRDTSFESLPWLHYQEKWTWSSMCAGTKKEENVAPLFCEGWLYCHSAVDEKPIYTHHFSFSCIRSLLRLTPNILYGVSTAKPLCFIWNGPPLIHFTLAQQQSC